MHPMEAHFGDARRLLSGVNLRQSRLEDAWDHWGTLLLALGLLSLEWILRKRYELI